VTYEESEYMYFCFSKLEGLVKGFVSKGDLDKRINNLRGDLGKSMNNLRGDMEKSREGTVKKVDIITSEERMEEKVGWMKDDIVEIIFKLLQNSKDQHPKVDTVGQGSLKDKYQVPMGQPSINRHALMGFDSNTRSNQGWSTRGIQLPKIYMRKFDDKDPMKWIFQVENFFDVHQV
jgi:septum formation topological specificity factor MinE